MKAGRSDDQRRARRVCAGEKAGDMDAAPELRAGGRRQSGCAASMSGKIDTFQNKSKIKSI
ncbi:MAG: hypothetical protein CFE27_01345 [Alphaproteobacteria bacterium PA1]|nr:MAG: hypothetical protein CFE27_01345 [Alphaproteobacteria bacterium PA1]